MHILERESPDFRKKTGHEIMQGGEMKKSEANKTPIAELNLPLFTLFLLFSAYFLMPAISYAHKVSIYAYAEDGTVFAEGYFVDGSKAKNSLIEVFNDKSGKKLLDVKTDAKGEASFRIPEIAPLKLVITASMGHKNDYTVSEDEIRQAMGERPVGGLRQEAGVNPEAGGENRGEVNDEIEAAVERVIERKLQPVKNILLQIKEDTSRPGITEILGGIGYILGLMGIIMYYKSRKR